MFIPSGIKGLDEVVGEKGLYASLTEDKATFTENMRSLRMNFE